jgi:hypothetical protein
MPHGRGRRYRAAKQKADGEALVATWMWPTKTSLSAPGLTVGGIIGLMCAVPFRKRQHHPVDDIDLDRLTRRGIDDTADRVLPSSLAGLLVDAAR